MIDSNFSQTESLLPRVAIVGRPNVGKSTLFNSLVGRRRTITDPTPGVTRDPVETVCILNGRQILLIDTGGYRANSREIDFQVTRKAVDSIESADLILFIVDVTGITTEDEELIELLRQYDDRILLVINKVDTDARESLAWNLHTLGFERVVHVSAEHRRNIHELENMISEHLDSSVGAPIYSHTAPDIRITLLGKPNTGKSTLLNMILHESKSIVSPVPGTTRDVLEAQFSYKENVFAILDTAGIRRKRAVSENVEYYSVNRALGSIENSNVILLVVDAIDGISDQDKKIATQVIKRGKGIILAFNKWDLVEDIPNSINAIGDRTRYLFPILSYAPFVPISALNGYGIESLLDTCLVVWRELQTKVPTGPLNRALRGWIERHPVPHGGGPNYAVRYMTQLSANPLRFVMFVNRTHGFPDSWISYVQNNIREHFDIANVPLSIEIRES